MSLYVYVCMHAYLCAFAVGVPPIGVCVQTDEACAQIDVRWPKRTNDAVYASEHFRTIRVCKGINRDLDAENAHAQSSSRFRRMLSTIHTVSIEISLDVRRHLCPWGSLSRRRATGKTGLLAVGSFRCRGQARY
jgi:hypothetical protein